MTLCFSHFSTPFWEVLLMPAIRSHTTMTTGLLRPLKERLLDYQFTTNLASYSRLRPRYSFNSIKPKVLVHFKLPIAYTRELRHFSSFLITDFYF